MCVYLADDSYYLIAVCTEAINLLCFEKFAKIILHVQTNVEIY